MQALLHTLFSHCMSLQTVTSRRSMAPGDWLYVPGRKQRREARVQYSGRVFIIRVSTMASCVWGPMLLPYFSLLACVKEAEEEEERREEEVVSVVVVAVMAEVWQWEREYLKVVVDWPRCCSLRKGFMLQSDTSLHTHISREGLKLDGCSMDSLRTASTIIKFNTCLWRGNEIPPGERKRRHQTGCDNCCCSAWSYVERCVETV